MKNILVVSPYHSGSHQAWAEGYQRSSRHNVDLLTLPGQFWKWRMHGGALTLARQFNQNRQAGAPLPDLILATDMLDLTTFLALTRSTTAGIPTALYMHENQLTYPLPADGSRGPMRRQLGERDRHYAFINYISMMAADRVFFNSQYHHNDFFNNLEPFLKHYPEYNELDTIQLLMTKSSVLPVGIDLMRLNHQEDSIVTAQHPPIILWNQRLEFDKNPVLFIDALNIIAEEGYQFQVVICGERFGKPDPEFTAGVDRLGDRVIHNGYANDFLYSRFLWQSAITLSAADHEYFGISILEAIYTNNFPILPMRLSYPELIPKPFHSLCMYRHFDELLAKLRWALGHPDSTQTTAAELAGHVSSYDWQLMAHRYDAIFENMVGLLAGG